MGFFKNIFGFFKGIFSGDNQTSDDIDDIKMVMWEEEFNKFETKYKEIFPFGNKADESYRVLVYENLLQVPAIDLYDGDYVSRLTNVYEQAKATAPNIEDLHSVETELIQIATEIQTYLKEETSSYEAAKLWDSKFVKGVIEHIPPHKPKDEIEGVPSQSESDDIMSQVMRAYRNWASFAQAAIDLYGSQRLINATYEAVEEGQDPMEYIQEILDLNQRDSTFGGGGLHEEVIVPYSGFFGSGFFL